MPQPAFPVYIQTCFFDTKITTKLPHDKYNSCWKVQLQQIKVTLLIAFLVTVPWISRHLILLLQIFAYYLKTQWSVMPRSFELIWASKPAQLFPLVTFCFILLNIDSIHLAKWARSIEVLLTWNWLILCARMSSPKRCFLSASKNTTSFRNGANWGWRRPLQALKNRISTSGREFSDSKIGFICTPTLSDIKLFAFKVGCFHRSQIAITPPSYAETSAWNGLRAKFQGVHVFFPALTDLLIKWCSLFHLLKTALEEW